MIAVRSMISSKFNEIQLTRSMIIQSRDSTDNSFLDEKPLMGLNKLHFNRSEMCGST